MWGGCLWFWYGSVRILQVHSKNLPTDGSEPEFSLMTSSGWFTETSSNVFLRLCRVKMVRMMKVMKMMRVMKVMKMSCFLY